MANTPTLLLRPKPYAGESLAGYQLRVAEANGYPSGIWLLTHFLKTSRITINSPEHAAKVASILGLEAAELNRLTYTYDEEPPRNYVRYFGQKVHLRHIKIKSPAICPHCLKEQAATSAFWELKYAVACPFHNIRLIDWCQQCGQKISWERSQVCICPRCNFDYRDSSVEIAAQDVLELVRLLYTTANISLLALPDEASPISMPMGALKSESLSALIWMFSFISRIGIERSNVREENQSLLGTEYMDVLKTVYFLAEWPERLLEAIYIKTSNRTGKTPYVSTKGVLVTLSSPKMPLLFQQLGQALMESARVIHGLDFRVDNQTLEHAKLKVSTCFS
jgi:hypothetical protein